MSNETCFPSDGIEGALDRPNWAALQKFVAAAQNLSPPTAHDAGPDTQTQAILDRISTAAGAFAKDTLPVANDMGNQVYNFATTLDATLAGLQQLMKSSPNKSAVLQLIGNLSTSAQAPQASAQKLAQGLSTFQKSTQLAGEALAARLTVVKTKASVANTQISAKSQDLKQQLAAGHLDADAAQTDIMSILSAANDLSAISFAGLSFSVDPGVTAATAILDGVQSEMTAWARLAAQLKSLEVAVNKAGEDELGKVPCFSDAALSDAQSRWKAVGSDAHDFMLNFYTSSTAAVPGR